MLVVDPTSLHQAPSCQEEPVARVQTQQVQESPKVPSRPTTAPRSKSQPLPPLTIPIRKPMKEISPSMGPEHGTRPDDLPAAEICVSPSWSDFGNSKKKKEKKRLDRETREQEKKAKKAEKEQQAAAKAAGKRLSKRPPPAAMETQRMPAALRSSTSPQLNSTATPKDNSRSSSRRSSFNDPDPNSETTNRPSSSRHSFKSFFSASQIPKFFQGPRSRSGSTSSQNTFPEGERQYLKDLINYADEQDASDIEAKPQPLKPRTRKVSFSHDGDDTTPAIPLDLKVELPWMAAEGRQGSNSSASSLVLRNKREGEYRHPSPARVRLNEGTEQSAEIMTAVRETTKARNSTPKPEQQDSLRGNRGSHDTVKSSQVVPTSDGNSYVQKHRMHQQQRSIAGYEDELALGRFNDLTAAQIIMELERQRLPPTPSDSFESLHRTKHFQRQYDCQREDLQGRTLEELKAEEFHSFLAKPPLRPASLERQPPPSPKGERASGLPRRPKVTSPSMSTTSSNTITKTSNSTGSPFRPISPPSPVSPETIALVSNISKAERVLETGDKNPPSPPPKSANRGSRGVGNRWTIETVQHPLLGASAASLMTEENLKPRRISSPNPTPNGLQKLTKSSTTLDLSQTTDDSRSSYSWRALDNANRLSSSRGSTSASTISSVDSIPTPQLCVSKPVPEVVIEGIDGDGMTRKASIKRPRSQPHLQDPATTTQDLSFLPELKHQALVKPDRKSPTASLASSRSSFGANPPSSSDKHSLHSSPPFPTPSPPSTRPSSDDGSSLPVGASSLNYTPKAAFRSPNPNHSTSGPGSLLRPGSAPRRSTMSATSSGDGPGTGSAAAATQIKPLAKMFVICCRCKFWHDMPSALYKEMAMSGQVVGDEHDHGRERSGSRSGDLNGENESERRGSTGKVQGRIETSVQCPWCEHGMSTTCCAGWSCVVYLHERHH